MNGQMTPDQVSNLLTLGAVILLVVTLRVTGRAAWRKWFVDTPDDRLTQDERDDRRMQRRGRR